MRRVAAGSERGSAVVEFVLVAPLLLLLALGVVQVGLVMHARATLSAAASEGARAGALAGADASAGERRARALVRDALGSVDLRRVSAVPAILDGLPVMTVRIDARLPLLGLLGATDVSVEGHALLEAPS